MVRDEILPVRSLADLLGWQPTQEAQFGVLMQSAERAFILAIDAFVGRDDVERRVVINTVGPHWDGNQVWFITAGGAIFAAWPLVYATAFSGFYFALMAVLWALR